jgi:hypothetical protein
LLMRINNHLTPMTQRRQMKQLKLKNKKSREMLKWTKEKNM